MEVQNHILQISNKTFVKFVPIVKGVTDRHFFTQGQAENILPSSEPRKIEADIPLELVQIYEKYPDSVEFGFDYWTFLSECQMLERYNALKDKQKCPTVDIAIRYAGMGHIKVLAYDIHEKKVLVDHDGGSNGYDREDNMNRRLRQDNKSLNLLKFQDWLEKEQESSK